MQVKIIVHVITLDYRFDYIINQCSRGEYRFTVYIENRYLRIDICIESNVSVSKEISIIHVNGQKCLFKQKIYLQVQKLR